MIMVYLNIKTVKIGFSTAGFSIFSQDNGFFLNLN